MCIVDRPPPIALKGLFCFRRLEKLALNGMEWNGMEWNGMEWNGMEYEIINYK
jgi:hypothetical protein